MYTITKDAKISLLGDRKPSKGEEVFESAKTLREAITGLTGAPTKFLVTAYNSIPGSKTVKKFETLEIGLARVIKACNAAKWAKSAAAEEAPAKAPKKPAARAARAAKAKSGDVKEARPGTKKADIIAMLENGATREQIQKATGWRPHSVRGFLSTLSKSRKVSRDEAGVYKVAAAHA
jgi:hypothetical protein